MRSFMSICGVDLRRGILALACVLAAAAAPAETLRVTAANSVGNLVYDVTSFAPPAGAISPLNTDGASHGSYSSLVLVPNVPKGTVDVLVADLLKGQIIRYTPAVGATPASTTLVWTGPVNLDGLSVDPAGNLYIVASKPAQVWVLPVNTSSPTGYASAPKVIENSFPGGIGVVQLQETVVATTATSVAPSGSNPGTVWQPGDLLVLVGNKNSTSNQNTNSSTLLLYRANTIANVLNGGAPATAPDLTLLSSNQLPGKEYGAGMDFWSPSDSLATNPTLLLLTTAGNLRRFDFTISGGVVTPKQVQMFASGLGSGVAKVKTGLQILTNYAYVTQALSGGKGQILQFGAPLTAGVNNLIGTASAGVNTPDGLAAQPLSVATASSCTAPSACDPTGVIQQKIVRGAGAGSPTGNVIETSCTVRSDPRVSNGVCNGSTLKVSTLCPGFGNEIIPGYLCGGSGPTGSGFALIRASAAGVDVLPGLLAYSDADLDQILPPPNPPCPTTSLAWGPFTDANPSESKTLDIDVSTGLPLLADYLGFCDGSAGTHSGLSITGVGLVLNTDTSTLPGGSMLAFAQHKLDILSATIDAELAGTPPAIASGTAAAVKACVSNVGTYLSQLDYACAANQAAQCDAQVQNDPNIPADYPGNSDFHNPWGDTRGRLNSAYFTINTRLGGNPPNSTWPVAAPPTCAVPVVILTATPVNIAPNGTSHLSWSTQHATACTASGGWSGPQALKGGQDVTLATSTTFTLTCTGANATPGTASVTVNVLPPPTISSFTANPTSVASGGSSQLSWSVTGAQSCSVQGGSLSVQGATSPLSTGPITAPTTYVLSCTNGLPGTGSDSTATAQVSVGILPPTVILAASPTTVYEENNTGSTLSWSSTNATSCTASGAWSGSKPLSGSATTGRLLATQTYILTCSNSYGGSASSMATVTYIDLDNDGD